MNKLIYLDKAIVYNNGIIETSMPFMSLIWIGPIISAMITKTRTVTCNP